jgi:ketopantoate hydroxymethyltransferase
VRDDVAHSAASCSSTLASAAALVLAKRSRGCTQVAAAAAREARRTLPVFGPIAIVVGAVMAAGGYVTQGKDTTQRVELVEGRIDRIQQDRARERVQDTDKLQTIDVRTARMETKLELLVPAVKAARP